MKLFSLSFLRLFLVGLLFSSCIIFHEEVIDDEDLVDVTYILPVYELLHNSFKGSVMHPRLYRAGKIVTYQHYMFVNPQEGIHVVDSDPKPQNIHFIYIP